jgi:uncharacterized Fe-S cluster protein YjdI
MAERKEHAGDCLTDNKVINTLERGWIHPSSWRSEELFVPKPAGLRPIS